MDTECITCYKTEVSFSQFSMNIDFVVINLAAILVATSYDNAQPVIKWGGLIVAVVSVVTTLTGG